MLSYYDILLFILSLITDHCVSKRYFKIVGINEFAFRSEETQSRAAVGNLKHAGQYVTNGFFVVQRIRRQ